LLMLVGSDCISSQKAFIIIIILLWFLSFSIFFGNMREHKRWWRKRRNRRRIRNNNTQKLRIKIEIMLHPLKQEQKFLQLCLILNWNKINKNALTVSIKMNIYIIYILLKNREFCWWDKHYWYMCICELVVAAVRYFIVSYLFIVLSLINHQ